MRVASILARKGPEVVSIRPDATVRAAAELLTEHRIGAVLVLDEQGAIAGILSERDIVRGLAREGAAQLDRPVSGVMTRDVLTCAPDATVAEIMRVMTDRRIRHLPVVDGGRLAGLVSIGDVVKERLGEAELEAETLRGYVTGAA